MNAERLTPRVAYLLKTFPRLSETFILNEVLGLEKLGMNIQIFSLKRPADEPVHPAVADVKGSVTYIPSLGPDYRLADIYALLMCHLALIFTWTWRYLAAAYFNFVRPGKSRLKDFLQAGYLAQLLDRGGFDHLHAHFANVPTTVAEVVHRLTGIPYSFTAHAKDIYLTPPAELARKIDGASCVLTCTAYNQHYLASLARSKTPVRLAYHGIDIGRFDTASLETPQSTSEAPLILSVGRFCEKKGFEYLLQACRILKDRSRRFRCQIVGYGELRSKLEVMINDLGLGECVSLVGKMTQDRLATLYPQASIFVLPCLVTENGDRDGIPNVLIEAMASRTAVVSTAVSGISELVQHNWSGLLVEQRNANHLADTMQTLMLSPSLRTRLAARGHETVVGRFSIEASASHLHRILSPYICPKQRDAGGVAQRELAEAL
jgi:glycosyltransferase involved in cell wall biosynthesis